MTFSLSGRIQPEQVAELLRTLLESEYRRVVLNRKSNSRRR
jgi:hypothetical protein